MPTGQPSVTDAAGQRSFACSPAAVAAFIVDESERLLLVSCPEKRGAPDRWEVLNGTLEAEETLLEGVLREEGGAELRVRPLGVIHAYTFRYDRRVPYVACICFLLAYEGGEVVPGDDVAGCAVRWVSLQELESGAVDVLIPTGYPWLLRHAIETYRALVDRAPVELQLEL